jgi:hypothetical protein
MVFAGPEKGPASGIKHIKDNFWEKVGGDMVDAKATEGGVDEHHADTGWWRKSWWTHPIMEMFCSRIT